MRRARRADVRLTRRADARSTSAPDGAPELLLPITYYVLPKNMNFCHRSVAGPLLVVLLAMKPTLVLIRPTLWWALPATIVAPMAIH